MVVQSLFHLCLTLRVTKVSAIGLTPPHSETQRTSRHSKTGQGQND